MTEQARSGELEPVIIGTEIAYDSNLEPEDKNNPVLVGDAGRKKLMALSLAQRISGDAAEWAKMRVLRRFDECRWRHVSVVILKSWSNIKDIEEDGSSHPLYR